MPNSQRYLLKMYNESGFSYKSVQFRHFHQLFFHQKIERHLQIGTTIEKVFSYKEKNMDISIIVDQTKHLRLTM